MGLLSGGGVLSAPAGDRTKDVAVTEPVANHSETITHNFNKFCVITAKDLDGYKSLIGTKHINKNQVLVWWEKPFTGTITLN